MTTRNRSSVRAVARVLGAAALLLGAALDPAPLHAAVAPPVITEPPTEGAVISPYDVHMVAGPFVGDPGETHVCSDWQILSMPSLDPVWTASCVTGTLAVHIHLGDGTFVGALAGLHQLDADRDYRVQVRFEGSSGGGEWSDWSVRNFHTASAAAIEPMVLSDVSIVPDPRWRDASGSDVALPASTGTASSLRLEVPGAGNLLVFSGVDGARNAVANPAPLSTHGPVRAVFSAGAASVSLAESRLEFTDGSGADRIVALPAVSLSPGQMVAYWLSDAGEAFSDASNGTAATPPTLSIFIQASASEVPWSVKQPGFRVERVGTGFQLPVEIAFLPNPGGNPGDPYYYVSELYGSIRVVTRSGAISPYASGLLNFDPTGSFPGSGEKGLAGIVVDPATGDLFAGLVEAVSGVTDYHFPRVIRLHSADGGLTMATSTTILDFPNEPLGPSHQISNVSIGPDGKLYVHIGDGLVVPTPAQDMTSVRGKILRVNFDGSAPSDNPFYDAEGLRATNLIYALGLRNPFGGAWRAFDGAQYEVENGPSVDRLAKVVAGRNYGFDLSDASMHTFAAYNWGVSVAPVNIAFVQPETFGGSGFPADHQDHAFVTESGPTWAPGPQIFGKRITDFVFNDDGSLKSGPVPLIEFVGAGRSTVSALAAGPDGLYFADLYKDFGAASAVERGASVFRIRYVGVADFTMDAATGVAPLTVSFHDASTVPDASAWHWEFGDGASSDDRNPTHAYAFPGSYDVRLTVSGSAGAVARQKAAAVVVTAAARQPVCCARDLPPLPRVVRPL
jgi:glucose/arabinose dehydrogenase